MPKNCDLRVGGSYSLFANLSLHRVRCKILEELVCPYELNGPYFRTRHGLLIWPMINLSAYTDLNDPTSVYIKYTNGKYVGRFVFKENHIELYECVDDDASNTTAAGTSNEEAMQIDYL
jgi:hypothetical protein